TSPRRTPASANGLRLNANGALVSGAFLLAAAGAAHLRRVAVPAELTARHHRVRRAVRRVAASGDAIGIMLPTAAITAVGRSTFVDVVRARIRRLPFALPFTPARRRLANEPVEAHLFHASPRRRIVVARTIGVLRAEAV